MNSYTNTGDVQIGCSLTIIYTDDTIKLLKG